MANTLLMNGTSNPAPLHGGRTLAPPHPSTYPLHLRLPPKIASLHLSNQPPLMSTSTCTNNTTTPTSPPSRRSPPQLVVPSHLFDDDDKSLHYPYRLLDLKDLKPNDQTEYYKSAGVESRRRRYPWDNELLFPDDARYIGSSHGWLAVVHPRTLQMFLFNPTDPEQIVPLPPLQTLDRRIAGGCVSKSNFPSSPSPLAGNYLRGGIYGTDSTDRFSDYMFMKNICYPHMIIMSSDDPSASNCVVMAVTPVDIFFCKPGDAAWTVLPKHDSFYIQEAIYSDSSECFYVTEMFRQPTCVQLWELSDLLDHDDHAEFAVRIDQRPNNPKRDKYEKGDQNYLVEPSFKDKNENENVRENEILLVDRFLSPYDVECHHRTITFDVYKLNFDESVWEPLECLGDQALFIGFNHCVSVRVDDNDKNGTIKPNCIYFTDNERPHILDYEYGGCDIGVFDMKENKIQRYHFGDPDITKKIHPPPIWFLPH